MHDKEESYAKQKGSKYMKRDDFRQYAANLRVKNTQYKTIVKQLDEVKSEVSVLFRTQTILKSRAENVDEFMADLEKKKGIVGYSKIDEQIQGVSEVKEQLDNAKSQSLQELTQLVAQIEEQVKDQKTKLAPDIKKMRNIRQRMGEMEVDYNEKKKKYDLIVSSLESEKERIQEEMGSIFTEYKEAESKFHSNNIQADIFETFQRRIQNEAKFISTGEERLAPEYKSYSEFFQVKVSKALVMRKWRY